MCLSLFPARFTGTLLCLSEAQHPSRGYVNVLTYENTVQNRSPGANAMLLHFPSSGMTRENVVDTRSFRGFTKDRAVLPLIADRHLLSLDAGEHDDARARW